MAVRPVRPMPQQETSATTTTGLSSERLSSEEVERIYREFSRDILAFLIGVLRDVDAAHDALQQTFQRVAEVGGSARPETLRGWLFQVAYREALQLRRREQREHHQQHEFWETCRGLQSPGDPSREIISQEQIERLRAALAELPVEQRDVVERRVQGESTFAEIAAANGVPLGTVLTRMRLAVERLRKRLRDE